MFFSGTGGHIVRTKNVQTEPFLTQNVGSYGLKKAIEYFEEANYLENFIECVLETYGASLMKGTLLIGGDGREYSKVAIQSIIQMCPAYKVSSRKFVNINVVVVLDRTKVAR